MTLVTLLIILRGETTMEPFGKTPRGYDQKNQGKVSFFPKGNKEILFIRRSAHFSRASVVMQERNYQWSVVNSP